MQATFLQPATDPQTLAQGNPMLAAQLQAMAQEELEKRCRLSGLLPKGTKEQLTARLLALDAYLNPPTANNNNASSNAGGGGGGAAGQAEAAAGGGGGVLGAVGAGGDGDGLADAAAAVAAAVASKPAAPPVSRWTAIDEEEEKQAVPAVRRSLSGLILFAFGAPGCLGMGCAVDELVSSTVFDCLDCSIRLQLGPPTCLVRPTVLAELFGSMPPISPTPRAGAHQQVAGAGGGRRARSPAGGGRAALRRRRRRSCGGGGAGGGGEQDLFGRRVGRRGAGARRQR